MRLLIILFIYLSIYLYIFAYLNQILCCNVTPYLCLSLLPIYLHNYLSIYLLYPSTFSFPCVSDMLSGLIKQNAYSLLPLLPTTNFQTLTDSFETNIHEHLYACTNIYIYKGHNNTRIA